MDMLNDFNVVGNILKIDIADNDIAGIYDPPGQALQAGKLFFNIRSRKIGIEVLGLDESTRFH